nr:inositol-pentakisphosphate 2-kinase isoform X1 [Megalopta genalis]XP_033338254.1 inositol-pentakisphosphate 2-kinase isoform X1 [Megalopta genalis]XP_033338255.1 inositol-pentakisphosphate 2-kinase isoform X1 [Megalopta genalis]XP_033338256.1 inositol-pentakisphosphate 2-kinase isoform X1 [Megalopta genalis]XP_033338259.1 inositol-pentakisphosphate 2-kinase isoform X1 [Megalopta genalis]
MRINEGNPVATAAFSSEPMTTSTGSPDDDYPANSELPLPLTTLSVEDCVYKGEGNANIVIGLPQEHKVIRFRKSSPDDVPPDGGKQRAEREVEFVRSVASCFLGRYTQIPEILRCDAKDIARLSEAIQTHRPEKRRNKIITETHVTKYPDYTFLQTKSNVNLFRSNKTFCVEIKPKQGYLREDNCKFQKCPYCLMQYHKLKKKVIQTRSSYCPLNLFSGVPHRMKSALKELLASPQNNLKIFKDGVVVYNQESSSNDLENVLTEWFLNSVSSKTTKEYIDEFCSLICASLLHSFPQDRFKPCPEYELCTSTRQDLEPTTYINTDIAAKAKKLLYFAAEVNECNLKAETLPNNCLLERILHMQKLPFVSAEYVYNIHSKLRPLLNDNMVYDNLAQMQMLWNHRKQYCKSAKAGTETAMTSQETHLRTCIKCIQISNRAKRKYNCDENKNVNLGTEGIADNGHVENISRLGKSNLFPMYLEDNVIFRNKSDRIQKAGNRYCNKEEEMDSAISSRDILCLQNYVLFSCARDCSILLAFRELNLDTLSTPKEGVIKLSSGLSFLCDAGISDLDPKSLQCIEKHRQRDTDILNSVINVLEEKLMLKNQSSRKQSL